MQRSSLVVFVFSAIGLAACGDETDSSSPAGAAGNNTAGSSNGGSDAGGSGGTGGSSQAGSGGGDQAGAAGSSQAGAGGSGVAGQNSSGTGGTAGSGAAGQGGSGEDLCKGICEHDTQLSSELQCKDGACAAQCPQIIALVEQKGCTGIYKTLLDCTFQQPSSSFACDPDNGGVDLKEEFCKPEAEAITKCLGF